MIIKLQANEMRFIGYIAYRYPRVIIGHLQRVAIFAYMDQAVAANMGKGYKQLCNSNMKPTAKKGSN
jgi:hypothetical protein